MNYHLNELATQAVTFMLLKISFCTFTGFALLKIYNLNIASLKYPDIYMDDCLVRGTVIR